MLFLKFAGGDRCWHSDGNYANFQIDDPWLIEPYGFLNYLGLLNEMEKENFHTTIAFIPWNYDRSRKEVIDIIRNFPHRYSLAIHGSDHDHREFYPDDDENKQEWKIKQSLSRMEEFRKRTNLPFDRIMVFPHGLAPKKTRRLIQKYNFLATVNAIPPPPLSDDFISSLNGAWPTLNVGKTLPHLWRYPPYGRRPSEIAMDLFIGSPVLFYTHHDFFKTGIGAFNQAALQTNRIQPGIQWVSLGHIVEHLFLQRRKEEGDWEIRAFSNRFVLKNPEQVISTFSIRKMESSSFRIGRVTADGKDIGYAVDAGEVIIELKIPPGESRCVQIEYDSEGNWQEVDPARSSWRVDILRYLSDVRDLWLPRIPFGSEIVKYYYNNRY